MSRYIGSKFKKSRRYNFSILENDKEFSKGKKRKYSPGQHGKKRIKLSNYGIQLQEKQKIKYMYNLTEKQLKNIYIKAKKAKGNTGDNLLILLESRLNNIIYRLGICSTRSGASQLINHGHILINNKKVNIPSYICKIGDIINIKPKSQKNVKILENLNNQVTTLPFIEFNKNTMTGKYLRFPERIELNNNINDTLIIEWYNKIV